VYFCPSIYGFRFAFPSILTESKTINKIQKQKQQQKQKQNTRKKKQTKSSQQQNDNK
jgi:hypothetical protein